MADPLIANLDANAIVRLKNVVSVNVRQTVGLHQLPVGSAGQNAAGDAGTVECSTNDWNRASDARCCAPLLDGRSYGDSQLEDEFETGRGQLVTHHAHPQTSRAPSTTS